MAIVHLPILLSWRLEFFELLTQFTSGCPQTGSLSTRARHNSFGLVRSTVLPREMQIGSSVYFHPWLNFHLWGILASIKSQTWRTESPNFASRATTSFVKYARFDTHLHHQPSKRWSMPSSARESISPTAFSMGQVPTSLTVYNRLQFGMTFAGSRFRSVFDTSLTPSRATACYGGPCTGVPDRAICK